jgi:hypothetical protein
VQALKSSSKYQSLGSMVGLSTNTTGNLFSMILNAQFFRAAGEVS